MEKISRREWFYEKIMNNPQILLWYYIIVNMVPALYFLIFEPVNPVGRLAVVLFPLGIYLFYFSLFKNGGKGFVVMFPLLFLGAFQIVLFFLYGDPDVIASDMFLNVVTTSTSEAGELLNSLPLALIVIFFLYIPPLFLAIRQWIREDHQQKVTRKMIFIVSLIITGISVLLTLFAENNHGNRLSIRNDIYPANMLYNLGFAINKIRKIDKYPETSKDFSFGAVRKKSSSHRQITVLVIGETSRAGNWQMYGYDRETNPDLSKQNNLVLFRDALTENNATHKSVPIILSSNDATNFDEIYQRKGIFAAFKEAGYRTVYLSNQADNRSFTEYFAKEADIYQTIRNYSPTLKAFTNPTDDSLTTIMSDVINRTDGDIFLVLHTYGSHFNYADRYPKGWGKFFPDNVKEISRARKQQLVNAYDNSILYTDYFLSKTIGVLEKSGASSLLLYTSDHGEDLLDDRRNEFLHSSPVPTYYQLRIPFFIWFSQEFQEDFPVKVAAARANCKKPISTNAVFHTLIDASEISTPYLDKGLSLVNGRFEVRPRMYLDDHDEAVPYRQMNLQPEDYRMIEKNKIGE